MIELKYRNGAFSDYFGKMKKVYFSIYFRLKFWEMRSLDARPGSD